MIELFNLKNGLSNQIMSELLDLQNIEYKFCSQTDFSLGAVYTTNYGLQWLRYFAPKIWNMIPADIRNVKNISEFTLKIKSWIPDACPFILSWPYTCQVG